MKIRELIMNKENMMTNVQCQMFIKQNFVLKEGRVEQVGDNSFKFITKDIIIDFFVVDKNEAKKIMNFFSCHFYCLASVTSSNGGAEKKIFFLHFSFFYNLKRFGKVPVIISENVKEIIKNNYVKGRQELYDILKDNFSLTDGTNMYFVYSNGKESFEDELDVDSKKNIIDDNIESIDKKSEDNSIDTNNRPELVIEEAISKEKKKKNAFIIYGEEFTIYATLQGDGIDEKLYVTKVMKTVRNIPRLRIAIGTLEFLDHNTIISQKVKETLENTKGYLDLWDRYADQEGQILFKNARKVGLINICKDAESISWDENGIYVPYFGLSKESEKLIPDDGYLFFSEKIPIYLSNTDITWQDYRIMSREADKIGYTLNKGIQVKVVERRNGGFILKPDDGKLPDMPYVSLSIKGDEEQIKRREEARRRIAEGRASNPALGLILEGQLTEDITRCGIKKIDPLSSFVEEKIFAYPPTETQKKAIDIALNTPDIAIIQGPPGTGKTTVITAIIERLNEICDKREKVNGQVLITSFQHDAVRNVIERLKINSLPTIKFGKQERGGEEDLTKEKAISEWLDGKDENGEHKEGYIEQILKKNHDLVEVEQRKELERLYNAYLAYPSDENAIKFLENAKVINIDYNIDKSINSILEKKRVGLINDNNELLILIRRLRTTKEGFMDDGAENADSLLAALEDIGINRNIDNNETVYNILDKAATCFDEEPNNQLLLDLQNVKKYLLKKCTPKPIYKKDIIDDDILKIYNLLNKKVKQSMNETAMIISELLKELRSNRTEVEKSLEHYLFVYSATTQQSEGREIRLAKGLDRNAKIEHPEYETVIVDEAARVSPTDLMIPLAQAKRRIILVGDHRQLPHIYDEEVFESLKENGEDFDMENIKKSMFEYMLEKAKLLEKIDHIQRTIVLDAQYRMHPILGEFINEVFYKPYGEYFSSPSPAKNYKQLISKKDMPIEWYDFPDKYGGEQKRGTSRIRDCEANFIVEKIKRCLESNEGKKLSYGVITFYSEQVKLIKRKLKVKLKEDAEKVRVGSVDAFQGMEFDVIFLSVVRSNNQEPMARINGKTTEINYELLEMNSSSFNKDEEKYKKWYEYKETVGLQNYGFLISENRLCVSLSRQKKLLIVVGNGDMFSKGEWGRLAEICVPGMKRLYELCKKEEVIYDGNTESI